MPGNFERRNNSHSWCQRGKDIKYIPPELHCFLCDPDCAPESSPVRSLFPGSTSDLPGNFLQVTDVFVQYSQKCHSCGTLSFTVFVFQSFLLKFCCPVPCILRCVTGSVSSVEKRAYGHPRVKPLEWKHSWACKAPLRSAGDFKPVNSAENIPHSNFTTITAPSSRAGDVSSLQNCKLNVSIRI